MARRFIAPFIAGAVAVLAVAIGLLLRAGGDGVGPHAPPDPGAGPAAGASPAATYVGRSACVVCHESPGALWAGSHHDLAMEPATPDTVLGDFGGASFTHGGVTSAFTQRDGAFFVRTDGPDGALADYRITHTFGVTPLQQYLVEFPGGRRQVLPLCWDTRPVEEGGGRWFHIYPGETILPDDPLHWTGPNQNWNFMCAECHSTNLKRGYDLDRNAYDTTWSEIDVSCEACHGPGSRHVAWARAWAAGGGAAAEDPDRGLTVRLREPGGWVMDMATGTAKRTVPRSSRAQIETCARCHSRRVKIHEDVVPGEPLLDTQIPSLLVEPLYHAGGQVLEEVYVYGSFVQSKMFKAGVTCADCHEPHALTLLADGNDLCARCHLSDRYDTPAHHFHEPGTPGASCVECHMPARTYMVVDPRRDHSLRVPRPDLTVTLGTPNACSGCHADRSASWAAGQVSEWYGSRPPHYGQALHAGRTGAPGAGSRLAALIADAEQPAIVRATALSLLAPWPGPASTAAIEKGLADADPLVRVAALDALEAAGAEPRLRLAVPHLDDEIRAVRTRAARVLAPVAARITDPDVRRALEQRLDEYLAAEMTNADRPEAHLNIGNTLVGLGQLDAAEASYRAALRLDPDAVTAMVNLADLHRIRGRDDLGEPLLRAAVETAPDSAAAHHALGLLLARQGRAVEAVDELRRAAGLDPGDARFGYVYAVALHSGGQTAAAIVELERVHARRPADRDVLAALAMFNRDAGDLDAAVRYAELLSAAAPDDPGAAQLLAELRARRR